MNIIGTFYNSKNHPYELSRQPNSIESQSSGKIVIAKDFANPSAFEDLTGFTKIWIIFIFHRNQTWKPKVTPPRGTKNKISVFASRSPYRPNPIGLSCVDLVSLNIKDMSLEIGPCDLINETPILDIKPYLPYCDSYPNAKIGWLENIDQEKFQISIADQFQIKNQFLIDHNLTTILDFIYRMLEFNPENSKTKRIKKKNDHFILSYRTWRIQYKIDKTSKLVTIIDLFSGYSKDDLSMEEIINDPYQDKKLHLSFNSFFIRTI